MCISNSIVHICSLQVATYFEFEYRTYCLSMEISSQRRSMNEEHDIMHMLSCISRVNAQ